MFDNPVFKCELLSVTPDIRVNVDENYKSNIANAETKPVSTILVQQSWNPSYMREIITKKLITLCRIEHYFTSNLINGEVISIIPKKPYFIKYNVKVGDEDMVLDDDLEEAGPDDVKEYIDAHSDKASYAKLLDSLFNQAEKYYKESYEKGVYSDRKQVKKLLKTLKK